MKIVLPLAGLGTRLRPHTYTRPKALVSLAGKPLLAHIIDRLSPLPCEEMIFITGYLGEQIEEYIKTHYSFNSRFVEQKEPKGQAHAIQLAREWINGPTFIVFADTIFETDVTRLLQVESDGLLYVHQVEDPRRFGVTVLDGKYVKKIVEKPKTPVSNLAIVGLYYFRYGEQLIEAIDELISSNKQTQGEFYLADAIQIMIDKGAKFETEEINLWLDAGTPSALLETNRYLLSNHPQHEYNFPGSVIRSPVYIPESARIEDSIIGPYVSLDEGAVVKSSIIQDSILGQECTIEFAALYHSLIGNSAVVRGSHTTLNVGDNSSISLGQFDEL